MLNMGEDGISIVSQQSNTNTLRTWELVVAVDSTSGSTFNNPKAKELHTTLVLGSSMESDPPMCVSSCIWDMMQQKNKFGSEIKNEIESSKVHQNEQQLGCDDDGK